MESDATYSSYRATDTHYFYTLYLINDNQDRFVKLYEDESITKVRDFATKFSKVSGFEYLEKIHRKIG